MPDGALPPGSRGTMSPSEEATARVLITALIHRYAALARDHADYEQIAALFEAGAAIVLPDGSRIAPIELRDMIEQRPPSFLRHHVTTVDIQFQGADAAQAQTFMYAQSHLKMHDHWGRCDDRFVRQSDGSWRFAEKAFVFDGADPSGWSAAGAKETGKSQKEK